MQLLMIIETVQTESGQGASVISSRGYADEIVEIAMTHFPQTHPTKRAPRIKVNGQIQALVMLEDGRRAKAKLQSVSITGGMLRLASALGQGDFVEVAFPTQTGSVRGMAEMLDAIPSTEGALQPFRFIAIGDDEHRALRMMVDSASDRSFLGLRSSAMAAAKRI